MNDLVFIKETIYSLKREYGYPLRIGNSEVVSKNLETGRQQIQYTQVFINNAIRLPNQLSFEFLTKIGQEKGAAIYLGSFVILIEKSDLKGLIPQVSKTWAIYNSKRVEIISADDFEYAWQLRVREIPGIEFPANELLDSLAMTDLFTYHG